MQKLFAVLVIAFSMQLAIGAQICEVKSGQTTTALVEVYTSEGCSSCPPADRRLSQMPDEELTSSQVVPLALHVDYWDYLGWKDLFAKPAFSERHGWLVQVNHHRTSYTPHFFVSGTEVEDWRSNLAQEIYRINRLPALANIRLRANVSTPNMLNIEANASSSVSAPLALFLAVTESKLTSRVSEGENGGVTLHHNHVVREWIGPIALEKGSVVTHREMTLAPDWKRDQLGVAGFVQNMSTGEVLQAVSGEHCL